MMFESFILKKLEKLDPEVREVILELFRRVEFLEERFISKVEFREEFEKVWKILSEVSKTQREIAEAHKETEEALKRLTQRVDELAEKQRETEEALKKLAERQRETEEVLKELTQRQKETEEELKKLVKEHRKTREMVGALQHTVGYVLEDRAFVGLPELLKKDFGITVEKLRRDFIEISPGNYVEVNIIGKGKNSEGAEIWIIGECKTQLKKKDVDKFLKLIKKIEKFISGEKILLMVTYQAHPLVQKYVAEKGIKLYFSYDMPLK